MILVVAALIRISPFEQLLFHVPVNLAVGVVLIAAAYCVGVTISSVMTSIEHSLLKYFRLSDPTAAIRFGKFNDDVTDAFAKIFGDRGEWSNSHFCLARALVYEKMPRLGAVIERQASLRQLRRNMVLPTFLLGIVGAIEGIKLWLIATNHSPWGPLLIAISLIGSYVVARALIKNGMYGNRQREMRDVCCGLLVYSHSVTSA